MKIRTRTIRTRTRRRMRTTQAAVTSRFRETFSTGFSFMPVTAKNIEKLRHAMSETAADEKYWASLHKLAALRKQMQEIEESI